MPANASTVIATYSRRMRLQTCEGNQVDARVKGKKLKPVCGDLVDAEPIPGEQDWLITGIRKRRNELSRPNQRGKVEVLAANIDLVVVVAAATPVPDWFIVDRYLSAAEWMAADAIVVFNKTDIDTDQKLPSELGNYQDIGYETLRCSAKTGESVTELARLIGDRTAILVGQSGVGKSSLINRVVTDANLRTSTVSEKTGEGRHTTVNSVMIPLDGKGTVIDSPGVRDYAPAFSSVDQAIAGFREIRELGDQCRFANCRHLREPNCAVKSAVEAGRISSRRYESYRRVVALARRLSQDHGGTG
jgi:ribosome biogenesis GTPase